MKVSFGHIFRQGPMIRTLLNTAIASLDKSAKGTGDVSDLAPGPIIEQCLKPRNPQLVKDYIRHVGGQPSWYKNVLPPHLFSQWGMPILAKTLHGLPYDLSRILNGGCRIEVRHPLPMDQPLLLKAQLVDVDDDGYRVILRESLITGTEEQPESLIATITAVVPLKSRKGAGKDKIKPRVPADAREVDRWRLAKGCGLEYAMLTGDFNPVHWSAAYARMFGFPNTIMHGYATMARCIESLNGSLWLGQAGRLAEFECRFVRPLVYPGVMKVYTYGSNELALGLAPGAPAVLTGTYTTFKEKNHE